MEKVAQMNKGRVLTDEVDATNDAMDRRSDGGDCASAMIQDQWKTEESAGIPKP